MKEIKDEIAFGICFTVIAICCFLSKKQWLSLKGGVDRVSISEINQVLSQRGSLIAFGEREGV